MIKVGCTKYHTGVRQKKCLYTVFWKWPPSHLRFKPWQGKSWTYSVFLHEWFQGWEFTLHLSKRSFVLDQQLGARCGVPVWEYHEEWQFISLVFYAILKNISLAQGRPALRWEETEGNPQQSTDSWQTFLHMAGVKSRMSCIWIHRKCIGETLLGHCAVLAWQLRRPACKLRYKCNIKKASTYIQRQYQALVHTCIVTCTCYY